MAVNSTSAELVEKVRELIDENSSIAITAAISDDDDLFAAGLQSLDCVRILIAVEDDFDCELPNDRIERSIFASIANLSAIVAEFAQEED